jgi:ATP-dependent protease HslVU (ClpYQ) ATPase subunit
VSLITKQLILIRIYRELDKERENRKQQLLNQLHEERAKKVQVIVGKQQEHDKQSEAAMNKRRKSLDKKLAESKLKEMDRLDNVQRAKRLETFKKLQIMTKIEDKAKKTDMLALARQKQTEKRSKQKYLIEKARKLIEKMSTDDMVDEAKVKQFILSQLEDQEQEDSYSDWSSDSSSPSTSPTKYMRSPSNEIGQLTPLKLNFPASPGSKRTFSPSE